MQPALEKKMTKDDKSPPYEQAQSHFLEPHGRCWALQELRCWWNPLGMCPSAHGHTHRQLGERSEGLFSLSAEARSLLAASSATVARGHEACS